MQTHNSLEKGKKVVINPCKKRATRVPSVSRRV